MICYNCNDQGAVSRGGDGNPYKAVECVECGKKGTARARRLNKRDKARSTGVNHHRLEFNPLEAALAEQWGKCLRPNPCLNGGYDTLQLLMAPSLHTGEIHHLRRIPHKEVCTERDYKVAASVIQWLGTNCGRHFLEEAQRNVKE